MIAAGQLRIGSIVSIGVAVVVTDGDADICRQGARIGEGHARDRASGIVEGHEEVRASRRYDGRRSLLYRRQVRLLTVNDASPDRGGSRQFRPATHRLVPQSSRANGHRSAAGMTCYRSRTRLQFKPRGRYIALVIVEAQCVLRRRGACVSQKNRGLEIMPIGGMSQRAGNRRRRGAGRCGIQGCERAGGIEAEYRHGKGGVRCELGHAAPIRRMRELAGKHKRLMVAAGQWGIGDRLVGAIADNGT